MKWTLETFRKNRAANLRMLISRYIRAGHDDAVYECTVALARVTTNRDERCGCCPWTLEGA